MSKVGSDSSLSDRTIRKRRDWVRGALSTGGTRPASPKRKSGNRFVAPHRLSDEQRRSLLASLDEQGIGDAESRSLFVAALEYDLASCGAITVPLKEAEQGSPKDRPVDADESLAELGQSAATLADQISRLGETSVKRLTEGLQRTDRFNRGYGDDYVCSLRKELERIAAVVLATAVIPSAESTPRPDLSADARRFILRAADAFSECFEMAPAPQNGAAFLAVIKAVTAATGIAIPADQSSLTDILEHR